MTFFIKNDFSDTKSETTSVKFKEITISKLIYITKLGIYAGILYVPVSSLCGFFGVEYCTHCYGITRLEASTATGTIFLGMIFGSPIWGRFSSKNNMILGNMIALICLVLLLKNLYVNHLILCLEMFVLGFACSSQLLVFSVISKNVSQNILGFCEGIISTVIMLISALSQSGLSLLFKELSISNGLIALIIIMFLNLLLLKGEKHELKDENITVTNLSNELATKI